MAAYVRVAVPHDERTSASVLYLRRHRPEDAIAISLSPHHLPISHLSQSVYVTSASRTMSASNLPSAMDVDEAAIDEGLYSRQL